jgi:dihydroneopterin triphosphate diphosphatase
MPDQRESFKRPESVLVVVYTRGGEVLLLKRADHPNFWQSVTGAMAWSEHNPSVTAQREVAEEIGLSIAMDHLEDLDLVQRYSILPQWRYRYAPDTRENTEHAFALEVPGPIVLTVHPEHTEYRWLDAAAAIALATSWTNRAAIERATRSGRHT